MHARHLRPLQRLTSSIDDVKRLDTGRQFVIGRGDRGDPGLGECRIQRASWASITISVPRSTTDRTIALGERPSYSAGSNPRCATTTR